MSIQKLFAADTWRLDAAIWTLIAATVISLFTLLSTPWLAPAAAALLVTTTALLGMVTGRLMAPARMLWPVPGWLVAGGLVVAYIALSSAWTDDAEATARAAVAVALLLAGSHIFAQMMRSAPTAWLEHSSRSVLVTFVVALLYLLLEELSVHAIKRALFWPFHAARWPDGRLTFDPTAVVRVNPTSIKWNMAPVNFLLWPTLLICALQLGRAVARGPQLAIAGAVALMIVLSDHKTSAPALAAAVVTFAIAQRFLPFARSMLMAAWVASFLVAIPLSLALHKAAVHRDDRVGKTMAARILIWHATAEQFSERPLAGVGAAATKVFDRTEFILRAPSSRAPGPATHAPAHAHNIYLQSLYELGVLGTVIFMAFGLTVLLAIRKAPTGTQPYLLATAATIMVTGSASFGLFEIWFMATFAVGAMVTATAVTYHQRINSDN